MVKHGGVAKWLSEQIKNDDSFPPVIFLSSQQINQDDPETLLIQTIRKQIRTNREEKFWKERLQRWMSRETNKFPVLILVLDGINERYSHTFWRRLLEKLKGSLYQQKIALLITCRTGYWHEYFSQPMHNGWELLIQSHYNNDELRQALAYHGLSEKDIDSSLYPLIKKPRYFDLMVKFRKEMAESGDITPARLVYEDWRDRYQRKSSTPLGHDRFQNLLRELAENHLQSQETTIRDYQIGNILPPIGDQTKEELLRELSTGGILVGTGGRYRVDKKMLTLGLGLLLADMVKDKCEGKCEADFVYETTQQWLEPLGADLNAEICEMAVYHALSTSYPHNGRVVLLQTWLESHNPGETVEKHFSSYFPANPRLYFELAERIWAKNTENQWGQDLIMLTFLKWKDNKHVQQLFQQVFEKWLGYVHSTGFPHQRGWHDEKKEKIRAIIEKRINNFLESSLSVPERRGVANLPLTIVEDVGLLRLGRLALAVISHLPRRLFLRSIIIGCLAEAVMDYPDKYDLFSWVIRSSEEDLEQDIIDSVNNLLRISADNIVVLQAAHRMLSFVGTTKARMLQKQFPSDLFDNAAWHEEIKANPCKYTFPWPINICQTCITDTDIETLEPKPLAMNLRKCSLSPSFTVTKEITAKLERLTDSIEPDNIWIAMMKTSEDHTLDFSEPAFCAHIPQKYVEFLHHVIQTAENRDGLPLRQLSIQLSKFIPIINEEEYQLLYQKWHQIISSYDSSDKTVVDTELFLFEFILSKQKADEQLKHILSRPADAGDLIRYETFFKQPRSWREAQNKLNGTKETIQTQRLLWYISLFAQEIPQDLLNDLIELLTHGESFIRSLVLKIVFLSGNIDVAKRVIDSGWCWHPDLHRE